MILLRSKVNGRPMETFAKLFGSLLARVYHCFDRIVILGHLPLLTRPENNECGVSSLRFWNA